MLLMNNDLGIIISDMVALGCFGAMYMVGSEPQEGGNFVVESTENTKGVEFLTVDC